MSSKYKSPLIRSRNTSATTDSPSPNEESPSNPIHRNLNDNILYDNKPQPSPPVNQNWRGRASSSPRFNSPRFRGRGSPYQWTPNRYNNSNSLDQNSMHRFSSHRPSFNKYKSQNSNRSQNRDNDNFDESFFHPSMLEDPWAPLLNDSTNNTEDKIV
ncbi:M-phase-specific PLK1-interacting protein-like [Aphis craccivora]|uniref:M-phase-specific PLK1-interacting protein-like n=1 Tax=Aphis craccivora TaxID=307492 RepID=A0A6G0YKE7_APHCR|nr:M-phase-specific PLK1-interacting protein-like [Aphis craccivora]